MSGRSSDIAKALLTAAAQVVAVPLFFSYEAFVRLVNLRRARTPLDPAVAKLMMAHHPELDLTTVRTVCPAVIPSVQRGTTGLTLGSTIFLREPPDPASMRSMSLVLHELVHVDQNRRHGRLGFARQYGVGWASTLSYRQIPLEAEAFDHEHRQRDALRDAIASSRPR
jgi:Domain of unknown function (DUF4157)